MADKHQDDVFFLSQKSFQTPGRKRPRRKAGIIIR